MDQKRHIASRRFSPCTLLEALRNAVHIETMEPPTNLDTGAVPLNPIKASDAPVPAGKEPHSSFALFKIQLRAILHKNLLLSKRDGKNLAREILVPAYWFLILVVIRLTIHDQTHDAVIVAPTEPTSLCMNSTKPHLPVDCYDPQYLSARSWIRRTARCGLTQMR